MTPLTTLYTVNMKLGVCRALFPLSGIHVSPLQLGATSIGDKWRTLGMGEMDKESSFRLLDAYFDNGGNFIDTANNYPMLTYIFSLIDLFEAGRTMLAQ